MSYSTQRSTKEFLCGNVRPSSEGPSGDSLDLMTYASTCDGRSWSMNPAEQTRYLRDVVAGGPCSARRACSSSRPGAHAGQQKEVICHVDPSLNPSCAGDPCANEPPGPSGLQRPLPSERYRSQAHEVSCQGLSASSSDDILDFNSLVIDLPPDDFMLKYCPHFYTNPRTSE